MRNICTLSDSYKMQHNNMYPSDTEYVYSYFESRNGALFNKTLFFGLQYLLMKELEGVVVTKEKIDQAEKLVNTHLSNPHAFNRKGWEYILNKCGGKLPIKIKAVPEGTPVSVSNVLMTVVNTDPNCRWLTGHLETYLTHVWYPSTVATLSYEIKLMLTDYAKKTCDDCTCVQFQLHDFGFRGATSNESAGIGGAGHLINFRGTDTIIAIETAMEYYNSGVCAYSVPASEHSVMTALGEAGEDTIFEDLLYTYPTGILSVVIDSYNYLRFIDNAGTFHNKQILNRDGKVVFRPDSGDPVAVTLQVIEKLGNYFGYTLNFKGYKVLNPKVGILWGDGIDYHGIRNILFALKNAGWASENLVVGMGGGLLQKVNRDTQRFAFKSSAQKRNGVWYDIQKKPLDATKTSKAGQLSLEYNNGEWNTQRTPFDIEFETDKLVTVFENGVITKKYSFDEIRKNSEA